MALPSSREKTIGENFQAQTKYRRGALPPKTGKAVSPFKVYANPLEVAALPVPELSGGKGLWGTLATTRESIPEGGRLRQGDVSQLLWASSGFTYGGQRTHATAVPLAGLETYLVVRQIEDVFPGVYHYNPREHALEHLVQTEPSLELADALLDTDISACAAAVAYTGLPGRIDDGAKSRAYRYLYLEAGAAAQCAMLAAVELGLAATVRAEFYDDELARLLQIDGVSEVPLCVLTLGT
ncbi:SagB-type dehydrogenase domain protein [Truepera radiovictrix DSM 17093]|uniref:SagB-type dehydrogenase domain protein n=1 Tax=Truepera radiovictrix (strain DSM 17093 / CIP 108686 / LMG 22925 / RQ-24) TaxID=649638 RepID=D7CX00_TRURR|nr:SagB-type dehydrogenase domain protein [Truepera radiovictrix DSM 17093]